MVKSGGSYEEVAALLAAHPVSSWEVIMGSCLLLSPDSPWCAVRRRLIHFASVGRTYGAPSIRRARAWARALAGDTTVAAVLTGMGSGVIRLPEMVRLKMDMGSVCVPSREIILWRPSIRGNRSGIIGGRWDTDGSVIWIRREQSGRKLRLTLQALDPATEEHRLRTNGHILAQYGNWYC